MRGGGAPECHGGPRVEAGPVLAPLPDGSSSGTWNADPIAAAAGVATLQLVRDTDVVERAITLTQRLIDGFNAAVAAAGMEAFAYGRGSIFSMCPGPRPALLFGDHTTLESGINQLQTGGRIVVQRCARRCSWRAWTS